MGMARAHVHVLALAVAPVVVAAALSGCGGSGTATSTTSNTDAAGSRWSQLSASEQRDAVLACRLATAVRVGGAGGAPGLPLFTDRYRAVQRLDQGMLNTALDEWFAEPAHRRETIGHACTTLALRFADVAALARRPHVEFAMPVVSRRGQLDVAADQPAVVLSGRLSPSGARLTLGRPADRARSTARWTIRRQGDAVRIAIDNLPVGVSYLEVDVAAASAHGRRLLVITRSPTSRTGPPRTFAPVDLEGTTSRTLPVLYIPRPAIATVSSASPVALSSAHTLLLAHAGGTSSTRVRVDAGLYHSVRIAAAGPWTLRIVPVP